MKIRSIAAALCAATLLTATSACSSQPADAGSSEVKVGAILSMSGVYAALGPAIKDAIEMGVQKLNTTGFEVGGTKHTLSFEYADDKSDAATAGVAALRQMVQADNLPVVAFGLGSSTYAPQLKRTPVPMLDILESLYPSVLQYSDHILLTRALSETYTLGCVDYAKKVLGAKSIAFINTKGEAYSDGLAYLINKQGTAAGLTVTTSSAPLGTPDYGSAISEALSTHPDVVYIGSVTGVALPVLKQLRQAGYTGPVMHSAAPNAEQSKAILGAGFNQLMDKNYDCAGTTPALSDNKAARDFAAQFQQKYGQEAQDLTSYAYDLPFIIAAAMTKAGTTSDREAILKGLETITVPKQVISGYVPAPDGTMFLDRNARTFGEVTEWCVNKVTVARAMIFNGLSGTVKDATITNNPCGG